MSKRSEVVKILRCAADLVVRDHSWFGSLAINDVGADFDESEDAHDVYLRAVAAIRPRDKSGRAYTLLEAALLVEEGTWKV